jgi:hypothetical protein
MAKLFLLILVLTPLVAWPQVKLTFTTGYGTYAMKHLKSLEDEVPASFPVQMKTLSSYPPYLNFEGSVVYQTQSAFFYGVTIGRGSTGGRMHYSDFSGSVGYDQLVNYSSIHAALGLARKYPDRDIELRFDLHPGVMITNFELLFYYRVGAVSFKQKDEFKSTNLAIQPTVSLSKRMGHFGLDAVAGINATVVRGKLEHSENKESYLTNSYGGALRADWSGFRVGIGVSYYLGLK